MFNIVLVEPEIPQNTGNIARTCAITGCSLHLVHPMGFSIEDKYLKRAGLDYWDKLKVYEYHSFGEIEQAFPNAAFFLASTRAKNNYAQMEYKPGDFLVFGKETAGLPAELLVKYKMTAIRIPMRKELRSLNLSNSAAIVLYEAFRQNGFSGLD